MRWLGSSLEALRSFPPKARLAAGFQLWRVQQGLEPNDWKPMTSIGPGVREIRVRTGSHHRVIYTARFADAIYVLHAFEKRARKTARAEVLIARARFRRLALDREQERGS